MEQYIVSARKYRPSTFSSVVGQAALTSTLKNAIATDRLAHAYLFCGSRGVGKTSCARIFAKTINCTNRTADGEACNECASCRSFNDGNSLNIIELDAASNNSVDDIRELTAQVQVPPTQGRYRVFIVDEVHMLSSAAFNAFLKTLEEPPSYVIFILATTEKHKIIPTILSRCQIYDFNRITVPDMVAHLQSVAQREGITAEPTALTVIARQADGAMRDALSIFDQVAASTRGNITYAGTIENLNVLDGSYYGRILDAILAKNIPDALLVFHEVRRKGFDAQFFLNGLGQYFRDLMLASSPATLGLLDCPDDVRADLAGRAARFTPDFLYEAMGLCNDADLNYRAASNKQLLVELTLIRIAQLLSPSTIKKRGQAGGRLLPIAKVDRPRAPRETTPAPAISTAPAPATATPGAAPAAAGGTSGPYGPRPRTTTKVAPIRVGGARAQEPQQQYGSGATTETAARNEPFTAEAVAEAWRAYAAARPSEPPLVSLMAKSVPELAPDGRWALKVDSPVSENLVKSHFDTLLPHMRDALRNDSFALAITVSAAGLGPEFWSDSQVLSHLMQSPGFAEFYKTFSLTLK